MNNSKPTGLHRLKVLSSTLSFTLGDHRSLGEEGQQIMFRKESGEEIHQYAQVLPSIKKDHYGQENTSTMPRVTVLYIKSKMSFSKKIDFPRKKHLQYMFR